MIYGMAYIFVVVIHNIININGKFQYSGWGTARINAEAMFSGMRIKIVEAINNEMSRFGLAKTLYL